MSTLIEAVAARGAFPFALPCELPLFEYNPKQVGQTRQIFAPFRFQLKRQI
ncbi:MAG: hypothetical protein MJ109_03260 [Kiritimatiellae bacterium]|nr:hypothetical protein [Kiritimatiellia bacterium]